MFLDYLEKLKPTLYKTSHTHLQLFLKKSCFILKTKNAECTVIIICLITGQQIILEILAIVVKPLKYLHISYSHYILMSMGPIQINVSQMEVFPVLLNVAIN